MLYERIPFDLRSLVDEVLEHCSHIAEEKRLHLVGLVHANVPGGVQGDPSRLRQVLINLLAHAITSTEHGEIVLTVTVAEQANDETQVEFHVADIGVNVAGRAPEPYRSPEHANRAVAQRSGELGFGLTISRQLVKMMGGRIHVDSALGERHRMWFAVWFGRDHQATCEMERPRRDLRGLHVCLIDGHLKNLEVLQHYVEHWGMRWESASNAEAALEHIRAAAKRGDPFDLALCDRQVPGMGGLTLAQLVKADSALASTALICLTSFGRRGDAQQARQSGFSGYLPKPVRYAQLYKTLCVVMGTSRKTTSCDVMPQSLVTRHRVNEVIRSARPKVLLAEDNVITQKVTVKMLEQLQCRVDVAVNGVEAVAAVACDSYDLVIMDCQMPGMDAFIATSLIRETSQIPIVALTTHDGSDLHARGARAGMNDVLSKPLKIEAMAAVLERWIGPPTDAVGWLEVPPLREQAAGWAPLSHELSSEAVRDPLDTYVLNDLKSLGGDESSAVLVHVVDRFLQETPRLVEALHSARSDSDHHRLRETACALKGNCRSIGASRMHDLCDDLARLGPRSYGDSDLDHILRQLGEEFDRVKAALHAELAVPCSTERETFR